MPARKPTTRTPVKGKNARKSRKPSQTRTGLDDLKAVRPTGASRSPGFGRASVKSTGVTVHTSRISDRLVEFIASSDTVVGCVAWIRDPDIIAALAAKKSAAIVVQKETMLKTDNRLRGLLSGITFGRKLSDLPAPLGELGPDRTLPGVRCVGTHIGKTNPGAPRMHHKFLVDVERVSRARSPEERWRPRRVWTGSFNFSRNADRSLENAVVIGDPVAAGAFFAEWLAVTAISEPLDWTARTPKPEWKQAPRSKH